MSRFAALLIAVAVGFSSEFTLWGDEVAGAIEAREIAALPLPTIDATLDAWTKAARACRSYDAKVRVYCSDEVFGRPVKITTGRFLYQRDGDSRFENDGDSFIWQKDALIETRPGRNVRYKLNAAKSEPPRSSPQKTTLAEIGLMRLLKEAYVAAYPAGPNDAIPYLLMTDATRLRDRYELTIQRRGRDVLLSGVAKRSNKQPYPDVDFLFRRGEPLPYAVRRWALNGDDYTVYLPLDPQLDTLPPDAETFLHPDLTGLIEQ